VPFALVLVHHIKLSFLLVLAPLHGGRANRGCHFLFKGSVLASICCCLTDWIDLPHLNHRLFHLNRPWLLAGGAAGPLIDSLHGLAVHIYQILLPTVISIVLNLLVSFEIYHRALPA